LRGERGVALDVEERLELLERLVAEALDPSQIGDSLEPAVLGPPGDDPLGLRRTDRRQQLQLLLVRGVEVQLAGDLLVARLLGRRLVGLIARLGRRHGRLDGRRGRRWRGGCRSGPGAAHRGDEQCNGRQRGEPAGELGDELGHDTVLSSAKGRAVDQNGGASPGGGAAESPCVARYASRRRRSSSSSSRSVNLRSRGTASRYTLIESSLLVWPAPHRIHQWPPSRLGIAASTLNVRFCNTTVLLSTPKRRAGKEQPQCHG